MKILVTGGGGFLGRHIVCRLLAQGDAVRVLGRRPYPDLAASGVECVQADLCDAAQIDRACAGIHTVFHVAAKAGIWGDATEYQAINVLGTRHILQACQSHGISRLVYTSTPSVVYGDQPIQGGDETLPYPPHFLTAYARTKAEAERMVLAANGEAGLLTCSLRPHLIWGPGDTNLIPRLKARAEAGRLVQVGDGSNQISVSYVENIADAHLAACAALTPGGPVAGRAYFVNEPEPVNCWGFIRRLLDGFGCPPVRHGISLRTAYLLGAVLEWAYRMLPLRGEPPMTRFLALQLATSHWFTIAKAQRDFGWTPPIPTATGLERLFAASQATV